MAGRSGLLLNAGSLLRQPIATMVQLQEGRPRCSPFVGRRPREPGAAHRSASSRRSCPTRCSSRGRRSRPGTLAEGAIARGHRGPGAVALPGVRHRVRARPVRPPVPVVRELPCEVLEGNELRIDDVDVDLPEDGRERGRRRDGGARRGDRPVPPDPGAQRRARRGATARASTRTGVFVLDVLASPGAGKTTTILATIARAARPLPHRGHRGRHREQGRRREDQGARHPGRADQHRRRVPPRGRHDPARARRAAARRARPRHHRERRQPRVPDRVRPRPERAKVVILSVPEGDDKPLKYPRHLRDRRGRSSSTSTTRMPVFDFDEAAFRDVGAPAERRRADLPDVARRRATAWTRGPSGSPRASTVEAARTQARLTPRRRTAPPASGRSEGGTMDRAEAFALVTRAHPASEPREPLRRRRGDHGGARAALRPVRGRRRRAGRSPACCTTSTTPRPARTPRGTAS